jgi:hypothetical protein
MAFIYVQYFRQYYREAIDVRHGEAFGVAPISYKTSALTPVDNHLLSMAIADYVSIDTFTRGE